MIGKKRAGKNRKLSPPASKSEAKRRAAQGENPIAQPDLSMDQRNAMLPTHHPDSGASGCESGSVGGSDSSSSCDSGGSGGGGGGD